MAGIAWMIGLLDGSRDRAQVIQAAVDRGLPAEAAERVLALLAAAGALDDFPAGTLRMLSLPLRARLAAELATVSLARGDGDGGARTLARRLTAQIRVHGGGRIGQASPASWRHRASAASRARTPGMTARSRRAGPGPTWPS